MKFTEPVAEGEDFEATAKASWKPIADGGITGLPVDEWRTIADNLYRN
jgi:hypothetical protein